MNISGEMKYIINSACVYFLKVSTRKFEVTYMAHIIFKCPVVNKN